MALVESQRRAEEDTTWCISQLRDAYRLQGLERILRRQTLAQHGAAGVLYAASLWLSNSAYLYLSVSFIQMSKSLMPGLVYFTGVALGTERFARGTAANMALIAFGVAICAYGEVNLPLKGVAQQLTALLFEARAAAAPALKQAACALSRISLSPCTTATAAPLGCWHPSALVQDLCRASKQECSTAYGVLHATAMMRQSGRWRGSHRRSRASARQHPASARDGRPHLPGRNQRPRRRPGRG